MIFSPVWKLPCILIGCNLKHCHIVMQMWFKFAIAAKSRPLVKSCGRTPAHCTGWVVLAAGRLSASTRVTEKQVTIHPHSHQKHASSENWTTSLLGHIKRQLWITGLLKRQQSITEAMETMKSVFDGSDICVVILRFLEVRNRFHQIWNVLKDGCQSFSCLHCGSQSLKSCFSSIIPCVVEFLDIRWLQFFSSGPDLIVRLFAQFVVTNSK